MVVHAAAAAVAVKSLQSCPTLCDPIDGSPPGSPVPGILQARTLDWVAISFSNAGKWKVKVKSLSRVWLFTTPWTTAHQAPPPMGFSRQEYWSGVPLPSPKSSHTGVQKQAVWNKAISCLVLHDMDVNTRVHQTLPSRFNELFLLIRCWTFWGNFFLTIKFWLNLKTYHIKGVQFSAL